jgi:hypothetical protein
VTTKDVVLFWPPRTGKVFDRGSAKIIQKLIWPYDCSNSGWMESYWLHVQKLQREWVGQYTIWFV